MIITKQGSIIIVLKKKIFFCLFSFFKFYLFSIFKREKFIFLNLLHFDEIQIEK
jgi:hypothetical protein